MRAPLGFLDHRGEMAARIGDFDWASHPLGLPAQWPTALRLAVDLCLGSSFPTAIYWGPELHLLYNDAWVPIPAERHPWALGRPAHEVWPDIWEIVGPQFARVLGGEGFAAFDQMLPMVRDGTPAETWWTYSLSPIRDQDGTIRGVFNQGNETTRAVLVERDRVAEATQLRAATEGQAFVYDLARALRDLDAPEAILALAAERLAIRIDADRAGFFRVGGDETLVFAAGWSNGRLPLLTGSLPRGVMGDAIRDTYRERRTVVVRNSAADPDYAGTEAERMSAAGLGVPLLRGGTWVAGFYVSQALPRDWTAEEVALVEAVAETAWDAVQRVDVVAALKESETKFRAIANSIDQMVWSTLPDGYHDYYNQRWYDYTGVPPGSTDGEAWNGMFHPDDRERAWGMWRHCLETGNPYRIEYRLRHRTGDYRWVLGSAQPVRDDDGRITRWFGTCTDIQEQVEAREVLARSRADLERAVADRTGRLMAVEERLRQAQKMEAVGQLTGGIAHDFNNMLAVVIGALDLLERRLAQGRTDVERYVDAARDGATRAAALTHRLLSFSRQAPLAPVPVDCNALIEGMLDLLKRTLGEAVRIETQLTAAGWHAVTDHSQLENAVLNLAVNARDAMPAGGTLTIHTGNTTLDGATANPIGISPGDYVCIAVTDTGSGMSDEVAARAFDPFFTTKTVGKGTGLGLSQVFGFVGQLGGHVGLETASGEGTTVRLLIPRYAGDAVPESKTRADGSEARGSAHETVLVVEDEDRVRNYSVEALRELGYSVIHAADGPAALAMIDGGQRADLLFTDVVMPEMDGRELAREAATRLPGLRVLYTSGYTRDAEHGAIGGAVLPKPFDVATLAARVRAMLDDTDVSG